jgi:hypothetical protein
MRKQRKDCRPEEGLAILRGDLLEKDSISKPRDELGLQPMSFRDASHRGLRHPEASMVTGGGR